MNTNRGRSVLVLLLALSACGHDWSAADGVDGDIPPPGEDGEGFVDGDGAMPDGDAEVGPDGDADGDAEVGPDGDADGDAESGPDADVFPDGPSEWCGNGVVEAEEDCDDGNLDETDGCLSTCVLARCGDGWVRAGVEECDPGGVGPVAGCDADCTFAVCGDGTVGIVPGLVDGFESGVLSSPPWENGTPYGFALTSTYFYDGTASLGSTNRGVRDSTAWIELRAGTDGNVCFWFMGESANRRDDEFRFEVDGSTEFSEDTEQLTWLQVCRTVEPGVRVFRWEYEREERSSSGLDAYYIDGIDTGGAFAEECDDGNTDNGDACLETCRAAGCGDGHVWVDREECDGNSRACTTSCGSSGRESCDTACSWSGSCTPPIERCNGLDDDCDGSIDETFSCISGASRTCTNACGVFGTQSCGITCSWSTCCASTEVCQCGTLCDDDCDGTTDEGCTPC